MAYIGGYVMRVRKAVIPAAGLGTRFLPNMPWILRSLGRSSPGIWRSCIEAVRDI